MKELHSTSATQVEKIATFFTGTAAEWWRNLPIHPLTWETRATITAQNADGNHPGYADHDEAIGLKELLLRQFRSTVYVAEARTKLKTLWFTNDGKEDLEAFATRMESLLSTIGLAFTEDDEAINGTHAMYLFDALPPWLSQKIREQGRPHGCPHDQ